MSKVKHVGKLDDGKYYVDIDASGSIGILHFTHEVTIWITDGEFECADEICSGGWYDYSKDEYDMFESNYPGIFAMAKEAVEANNGLDS